MQAKNETRLTAGQASKTGRMALITGITGQDGGYLAELLLRKGYRVHGFAREATMPLRLQHAGLADDPNLTITALDMRDDTGLEDLLADCQPDEIYNLAAQSHIHTSFERPDETSDINATATMRLLKLVVRLGLVEKSRIYQASTSEIFGDSKLPRFDETAPFHPMSPYAVSKLAAFEAAMNYREAYNVHVSNGILFNHESPYRGENFVTRKITRSVAQLTCDTQGAWTPLHLGNLDASRDWGHARDYVDAMWRMLQQDTPGDYVIATGSVHSVRELVEAAFGHIDRTLVWDGAGVSETGRDAQSGELLVCVDPQFFRPTEIFCPRGDARKALKVLGWSSTTKFEELVSDMVRGDIALLQQASPKLHSASISLLSAEG